MTCIPDPATSLSGKRILIVEDEPLLALELVEELESLGLTPLAPVASVAEALSFIKVGRQIDAALLNVHLRGELSFPVADRLSRLKIPYIFVTGNDAFVREHFPDVPSHPKPSDMRTLVKALALLCEDGRGSSPSATMPSVQDRSVSQL